MSDSVFRGLFDTNYISVISLDKFLLCVGVSLLIGVMIAFTASLLLSSAVRLVFIVFRFCSALETPALNP